MKRNKIIAIMVVFTLIFQVFAIVGSTAAFAVNSDFETLSGSNPSEWLATNATISSNSTYWHSGSKSMKIDKSSSSSSETTVTSTAKCPIDKTGISGSGDLTLEYSMWYRAQNSNTFMRLDAIVYDGSQNQISTHRGNTVMLPRSSTLCEWTEVSTKINVSSNAAYISYSIHINSDDDVGTGYKATVYVDDITCKAVETYYESISDYCDFHGTTETGAFSGWSVSGGTFTASNGAGVFTGNSASSTVSYKTVKLSPECSYEIDAKYTSSAACTAGIKYYGVNGDLLKTDTVNLAAAGSTSTLQLITDAPDAVSAEFYISGNTTLTIDDLYFFKTSTRNTDPSNGWTADSIWYPENPNTDAYWQFRYFRITFDIPTGKTMSDAFLQMAYDDNIYDLKVNGYWYSTSSDETISMDGKKDCHIWNIKSRLTTGKNVIAVKVLNCALSAGLMAESYIHFTDGTSYHLTANPENTKVSKLNCNSSRESDYSTFADSPSNWNTKAFDDSSWETPITFGKAPYGNLGDVSFAYKYSDCFTVKPSSTTPPTATVTGSEENTISIRYGKISTVTPPETATGMLFSNGVLKARMPMTFNTSKSGTQNYINFTYSVPDYLPSGSYAVKLYGIGLNNSKTDVLFNLEYTQDKKQNPTVKVENQNGSVKLKVNNQTVSPVMYTRPSNASAYYNYSTISTLQNSELPIYCTYNGYLNGADGAPIWTAPNTVDYDAFDTEILRTLALNQNAYIIVNISADAPDWWLSAHPDDVQKTDDGTTIGKVSFASTAFREDASNIIKLLVGHMKTSSYSHRVIGVKISAGKTNEWMNYLRSDDDTTLYNIDYSNAMKTAFGKSVPTMSNRAKNSGTTVLDSSNSTNQTVIAYNRFLSQCVTDSFLTYAQAVKTVAPNLIVGGYNAYAWFESSSLGIGTTHTTAEQVLSSDYIDFVSSPINYSERINGYATNYMTLPASIKAHGKLYLPEQDNRTIYGHIFGEAGSDNAVGLTNTLNDSINQLNRDLTTDFVSGNGFWFYDMEGGWFDDSQLQSRIKTLKDEYDLSAWKDTSSNNEIAVFVAPDNYDYLNYDLNLGAEGGRSTYLLDHLYKHQRTELAKIGASYDAYSIEDLTSSKVSVDWSQYKLIIMLSPFNITTAQRTAITNNFKKDGKYILWVYMPGVANGNNFSASNIQSLVDMEVSVLGLTSSTSNYSFQASFSDLNYGSGNFGSSTTSKVQRPYISGGYDGVIASFSSGSTTTQKRAMAYKNATGYTSVYSAAPCVPASAIRKICQNAGVHLYTSDADTIINTNKSYISVNSPYAGTQTVALDGTYNVYDVYAGQAVAESTNFISVTLKAGETKLYRLEAVEDVSDYDGGLLTNGDFHLKSGSKEYMDWQSGSVPTLGSNLLTNGDFENSFTSWSKSESGNATVTIVNDGGNNVLKMNLPAGTDQGFVMANQFVVKPSTEYVVTYRIKINSGAQCYSYFNEFDSLGGTMLSDGNVISASEKYSTNEDWETVSYTVTTSPNTTAVRFDLLHNGVAGTSYWDDITVIENTPVENPDALSASSAISGGVAIRGNNSYINCVTLKSESSSAYILDFDCSVQNSGKAVITVYKTDETTVVKSQEVTGSTVRNFRVAIPSVDSERFYLKITLQNANDSSVLNIGNITMKKNVGDFDNNGTVAADDFVTFRNALIGRTSVTELFDLNGDSNVDVLDLVRLKKYSIV